MPRYYFHVHDNGTHEPDEDGTQLSDGDDAHAEAMTTAGEILKIKDGHFRAGTWNMRVVDEDGGMVSNITISVDRAGSA